MSDIVLKGEGMKGRRPIGAVASRGLSSNRVCNIITIIICLVSVQSRFYYWSDVIIYQIATLNFKWYSSFRVCRKEIRC